MKLFFSRFLSFLGSLFALSYQEVLATQKSLDQSKSKPPLVQIDGDFQKKLSVHDNDFSYLRARFDESWRSTNLDGLFESSEVLLSQANPSQDRFPERDIPPGTLDLPPEDEEDIQRPDPEILPEPSDDSQVFEIRGLEIAGSTVFSEAELKEVALPFLLNLQPDSPADVDADAFSEDDRDAESNAVAVDANALEEGVEITLSQLQQAANAITEQYIKADYITSQATIPQQTLENGIVQIQIIEGSLEDIQVEGTERLTDYVSSRIALAGGTPLNARDLEGQLRLLRNNQLFEDVSADLLRGEQSGASVLEVTVEEANSFQGNIRTDTQSSLSVGRYRFGATLQYLNLTGLGDRFSALADITTTGGSKSYELAYEVPISPMDGSVLLRFAPSNFRITNLSATSTRLPSSGSSDIYEVAVRQPLIRTFDEELALSLGFRYRDGSTVVAGLVTPPIETSVFTFGQDYRRRDSQGVWALQSEFRLGTELFGATTRPAPAPDGQFFLWTGQVQRAQQLSRKHLLIIQADAQFTGDNLVGSEQFFVGGPNSVRGYFQNQRFGDNGFRFSVADYITLLRDDEDRSVIQLVPFVDTAYAWFNNSDIQSAIGDENFLLSTGLGLVTSPIDGLNASVDLGVPLINIGGAPDVLVDFSIRYNF